VIQQRDELGYLWDTSASVQIKKLLVLLSFPLFQRERERKQAGSRKRRIIDL
jgi:hypothetical protein